MPRRVPLPDGSVIEVPDDYSDEQALATARNEFPDAFRVDSGRAKQGFIPSFKEGIRDIPTGIGYLGGILSGVSTDALREAYKKEEQGAQERIKSTSMEDVEKAFKEYGIISRTPGQQGGLGTLIDLWKETTARSFPTMAAIGAGSMGGAKAAAALPIPHPAGRLAAVALGGIGGGILGGLPVQTGQMLGRQFEADKTETKELDRTAALAGATGAAAFDVASQILILGRLGVGSRLTGALNKLLKRGDTGTAENLILKEAEKAAVVAQRGAIETGVRGIGRGIATEMPTEVAQQVIERAQAGLSLLDGEAIKEYQDTAITVAGPGALFGGVGGFSRRAQAAKEDDVYKALQGAKTDRENAAAREQEAQFDSDLGLLQRMYPKEGVLDTLTSEYLKASQQRMAIKETLDRTTSYDAKVLLGGQIKALDSRLKAMRSAAQKNNIKLDPVIKQLKEAEEQRDQTRQKEEEQRIQNRHFEIAGGVSALQAQMSDPNATIEQKKQLALEAEKQRDEQYALEEEAKKRGLILTPFSDQLEGAAELLRENEVAVQHLEAEIEKYSAPDVRDTEKVAAAGKKHTALLKERQLLLSRYPQAASFLAEKRATVAREQEQLTKDAALLKAPKLTLETEEADRLLPEQQRIWAADQQKQSAEKTRQAKIAASTARVRNELSALIAQPEAEGMEPLLSEVPKKAHFTEVPVARRAGVGQAPVLERTLERAPQAAFGIPEKTVRPATPKYQGFIESIDAGQLNTPLRNALGLSLTKDADITTWEGARDALPALDARATEVAGVVEGMKRASLTPKQEQEAVKTFSLLDELRRLQNMAQQTLKTAPQELPIERKTPAIDAALDIEPDKPSVVYRRQAAEERSKATSALLDYGELIDDLRKGVYLGAENVGAASETLQKREAEAQNLISSYVTAFIRDIALTRKAEGKPPLSMQEAREASAAIEGRLTGVVKSATDTEGKIQHDERQIRTLTATADFYKILEEARSRGASQKELNSIVERYRFPRKLFNELERARRKGATQEQLSGVFESYGFPPAFAPAALTEEKTGSALGKLLRTTKEGMSVYEEVLPDGSVRRRAIDKDGKLKGDRSLTQYIARDTTDKEVTLRAVVDLLNSKVAFIQRLGAEGRWSAPIKIERLLKANIPLNEAVRRAGGDLTNLQRIKHRGAAPFSGIGKALDSTSAANYQAIIKTIDVIKARLTRRGYPEGGDTTLRLPIRAAQQKRLEEALEAAKARGASQEELNQIFEELRFAKEDEISRGVRSIGNYSEAFLQAEQKRRDASLKAEGEQGPAGSVRYTGEAWEREFETIRNRLLSVRKPQTVAQGPLQLARQTERGLKEREARQRAASPVQKEDAAIDVIEARKQGDTQKEQKQLRRYKGVTGNRQFVSDKVDSVLTTPNLHPDVVDTLQQAQRLIDAGHGTQGLLAATEAQTDRITRGTDRPILPPQDPTKPGGGLRIAMRDAPLLGRIKEEIRRSQAALQDITGIQRELFEPTTAATWPMGGTKSTSRPVTATDVQNVQESLLQTPAGRRRQLANRITDLQAQLKDTLDPTERKSISGQIRAVRQEMKTPAMEYIAGGLRRFLASPTVQKLRNAEEQRKNPVLMEAVRHLNELTKQLTEVTGELSPVFQLRGWTLLDLTKQNLPVAEAEIAEINRASLRGTVKGFPLPPVTKERVPERVVYQLEKAGQVLQDVIGKAANVRTELQNSLRHELPSSVVTRLQNQLQSILGEQDPATELDSGVLAETQPLIDAVNEIQRAYNNPTTAYTRALAAAERTVANLRQYLSNLHDAIPAATQKMREEFFKVKHREVAALERLHKEERAKADKLKREFEQRLGNYFGLPGIRQTAEPIIIGQRKSGDVIYQKDITPQIESALRKATQRLNALQKSKRVKPETIAKAEQEVADLQTKLQTPEVTLTREPINKSTEQAAARTKAEFFGREAVQPRLMHLAAKRYEAIPRELATLQRQMTRQEAENAAINKDLIAKEKVLENADKVARNYEKTNKTIPAPFKKYWQKVGGITERARDMANKANTLLADLKTEFNRVENERNRLVEIFGEEVKYVPPRPPLLKGSEEAKLAEEAEGLLRALGNQPARRGRPPAMRTGATLGATPEALTKHIAAQEALLRAGNITEREALKIRSDIGRAYAKLGNVEAQARRAEERAEANRARTEGIAPTYKEMEELRSGDVITDLRSDDGTALRLRKAADDGGRTVNATAAQSVIDQVEQNLPEGVRFMYAPTKADIPANFSDAITQRGVDPNDVQGLILPSGEVLIVGDNHASLSALRETIAHELIGHYGPDTILGAKGFKALSDKVWQNGEKGVRAIAKALGVEQELDAILAAEQAYQTYTGKTGGLTDSAKLAITRELVADTATNLPKLNKENASLVQRFIKWVVNAFRNFAPNLFNTQATSQEIFNVLQKSMQAFQEKRIGPYRSPANRPMFKIKTPSPSGSGPASIIGNRSTWNTVMETKANILGLTVRVKAFDTIAALTESEKRGVQQLGLTPSDYVAGQMTSFIRNVQDANMHVADTLARGARGIIGEKRPDGTTHWTWGGKRYGPGLMEVIKPLERLGPDINQNELDATYYGLLQRANAVGEAKLQTEIAHNAEAFKKFKEGRATFETWLENNPDKHAVLKEWFNRYQDYNAGLIDMLIDAHAISKKEGERLKSKRNYIPMYRVRGDRIEMLFDEGWRQFGDLRHQAGLKELLGGSEKIMPFFTSSIQNTHTIVNMALHNRATTSIVMTFKQLNLLKKHSPESDKDTGIYNGYGTSDSPDIVRFNVEPNPAKPNDDGKRHAFINTDAVGVPTALTMEGLKGISVQMPFWLQMMAAPANFLRKMVVYNPMFGVRQLYSDLPSLLLTSGAGIAPIKIMRELVGAVKSMASGDTLPTETVQRLQEMGMMQGWSYTGTPQDYARISKDIVGKPTTINKLLARLHRNSLLADAFSRAYLFDALKTQGMSEMEAGLAVREALDFTRHGSSPGLRILSAVIPFMNTQMQSLYAVANALSGKMPFQVRLKIMQKFWTRGLMITAGSLAYAASMDDNDAYKKASPAQRYYYWFVPVPGFDEPLRIRVPFEVGIMFKSFPEAMYQMAMGAEKGATPKEALGGFKDVLMNSWPIGFPPPVKAAIEQGLNVSTFTGRPLEGGRLSKFDPVERSNLYTTEVSKGLSKIFNELGIPISPVRIDSLVSTFGSGTAMALFSAFNPLLHSMQTEGAGPIEQSVSRYPIIGTAFQPGDSSGVVYSVYEKAQEMERFHNTLKLYMEQGRVEKAQEYAKQYATEIGLVKSGVAPKAISRLNALKKEEQRIINAPESVINPERKREILKMIRNHEHMLATQYREAFLRAGT